jgi:hypothetical protein
MPRAKKLPVAETDVSARREQLRAEHADAVREKIQVTKIVEQLQQLALGTSKAKWSAQRMKAVEMLLDKTVPNLASVKHEVETDKVSFFINTNYTKPPETPAA